MGGGGFSYVTGLRGYAWLSMSEGSVLLSRDCDTQTLIYYHWNYSLQNAEKNFQIEKAVCSAGLTLYSVDICIG